MTDVRPEGTELTWGFLVLHNGGDRPVTLRSVEPVWGEPGLAFIGARVVGPERVIHAWQAFLQFPPEGQGFHSELHPVNGYVMPTFPPPPPATTPTLDDGREWDAGHEVMIGLEVASEGRSTMRAVEVTYEVDGIVYRQEFTSTVAICTSGELIDCEAEYGDES